MVFPRTFMLAYRVGILLLITALIGPACLADDSEKEQKKLDALKRRIQLLQQDLRNQNRERDQLAETLRKSEITGGKIRKQIEETNKQIKSLQKELASLNQQHDTLDKSRQAQQTLIGQHINAAYRLGREQRIKLLLNEEDPARFSRILKYHDYFLKARTSKIEEWLATLNKLANVKTSISKKEQQLIAQRDQLNSRQNELKTQIAERKLALANIRRTISSDQQKLAKLEDERQALEAVLTALEQAVTNLTLPSNAQPFSSRRGKMIWPVHGKLQHRFGARRRADINWTGWLLTASEGSSVQAIHHGRVVFSDYLRGHGLLLIIDHGNGYMSLYAHNQVLLKEAGDWVQTGAIVSKVGNSGGLSQNALYFEIRHNGKPSDPAKWLKKS